jgi:N6-L-threonylcarbamoyladenine synthase
MKILAFETSCDDTSIALFENEVLIAMHTKSQIHIHNETGGVVPEVASREHANVIFEVLDEVLKSGNTTLQEINYLAVTTYPWLVPSLLTGMTVASTLSQTLKIPIIPINHIEAHIFSNFLERSESEIEFPLVCLTVSWGHNEIYFMQDMFTREKLWQSQDDAAGEAYDKVAKMMGLGYPGGPIISKLAGEYPLSQPFPHGEKGAATENKPLFPRVYLEKSWFEFSFAGLKSAVSREIQKRGYLSQRDKQEISYEFQSAVNEVLCYKIMLATKQKWVKTVLLAGGVSANDDLRTKILQETQKQGLNFFYPTKKLYCMDNAAMIGILAYYKIKYEKFECKIGTVELGIS